MEDILRFIKGRMIRNVPGLLDETSKQLIAETRVPIAANQDGPPAMITNTGATGRPICS